MAGIATRNGRAVVEGVSAGDKLLRVDGLATAGATMGAVADALRGTPGATRTLVVEREGKPLVIEAKVTRFP